MSATIEYPVLLNGVLMAKEQAMVPIEDRGFLFGDAVYEVIPVFGRRIFRLDEHVARLQNSLRAVGIADGHGAQGWCDLMHRLLAAGQPQQPVSIYVQVSRGVAPRSHQFPESVTPTELLMLQNVVSPAQPECGVSVITLPDNRWSRCDIKCTALLANVLLKQQAHEQGADEAILIRDGQLTEGSSSNVLCWMDGALWTHPLTPHILPGITRDLMLELARDLGLTVREEAVDEAQLLRCDEIMVCSSTRELLPVVQLNGQCIGNGKGGAVWQRLRARYEDYKRSYDAAA